VPGTGGDSRAIAKIHWEALQVFLEDFLKRGTPDLPSFPGAFGVCLIRTRNGSSCSRSLQGD
jgi:hypothetical protein